MKEDHIAGLVIGFILGVIIGWTVGYGYGLKAHDHPPQKQMLDIRIGR